MAKGEPPKTSLAQLKSFIVHLGDSPNSGHYIGYVKKGDKWYCCNDKVISKALTPSEINEAKKQAYIAFFEVKPQKTGKEFAAAA